MWESVFLLCVEAGFYNFLERTHSFKDPFLNLFILFFFIVTSVSFGFADSTPMIFFNQFE